MSREKPATFIDERIRRCRHCGAEMETGPLSYEENPYCVRCLDERTRTATAPGELAWAPRGRYIEFFKKGNMEQATLGYCRTTGVLNEVYAERCRQDVQYGEQNHLDIQPVSGVSDPEWAPFVLADRYHLLTAKEATRACEAAFAQACGDWARILVEEVCEAIGAALDSQAHLRRELLQVAAVCVAWVECIDRRGERRDAAQFDAQR